MSAPGAAIPDLDPKIPDKLYFRIGEVAQLAGVEPYVLRFWETEFPQLAPKKSGSGHRLYRRKEVELILEVKRLLRDKRFTIEGARKYLEQNKKKGGGGKAAPSGAAASSSAPGSSASSPRVMEAAAPMQASLFGPSMGSLDEIRKEVVSLLEFLGKGKVGKVH
jgi:DNA-binding transcriptional MerR regulator